MTEIPIKITICGRTRTKDNQSRAIGKNGRYFTRPEFRAYENSVKIQARAQMNVHPPLEGPLFVIITFYFKNNVRPDLFNSPKSLCDALNGIAWKDDKQIVMGLVRVVTGDPDERAELNISIVDFGEQGKSAKSNQ